MCDEDCLESVEDPVPQSTVFNCLQRIFSKSITYKNEFPKIFGQQ